VSAARQLTRLTVLAVLACALVYVVALGTRWGLRADAKALPGWTSGIDWERAHVAARRAVHTIHVATIVAGALAAAAVALARRRRDLAAVAVTTLAGANLTTFVLKPLLARTDPLGGEASRALDASFPSGHATAAMSLALVAVIVAPRRWRPWVAVVAAVYAATVGVALVLRFDHYPSDVVGGYLVATAWATAMAAIALRHRATETTPVRIPSPGAVLAGAGAVVAAGGLLLVPASHLGHGVFAVSAVVIAGVALLLPVALSVMLSRS
jgi:membrane-associated phospholipid phosphatase